MPSNTIAPSSFVTGPNDSLTTVDVFTGTSSGIVNSITSLSAQYDVDLIGMLRAGSAAAQVLPLVQGIVNGQALLNPQAAIARLLTASNTLVSAAGGGSLTTAFNSLSSGLQSTIGGAGSILGSVTASVGDVVSSIVNGGISDVQSLGSLINGFSNSSSFMMVDTQALAGMAVGVINQCANYGISGAFGMMVSNITNPNVLNAIIQQTLPGLVASGDLVSLQALAVVASAAGIAAVNPGILSSFTQGYSRSASGNSLQAQPFQDQQTWVQVNGFYTAANPNWNTYPRSGNSDGESTINLASLQGGTDDFNSVLAAGVFSAPADDAVTPMYGLAAVYGPTDVDTQLKSMYPSTYIDPALRSTPIPVEPTQLQSDGQTVVSAASSVSAIINHNTTTVTSTPPANDRVGDQPNPATYQTVTTDEQWSNTVVNWSESSDGQSSDTSAITFSDGVTA